MPIKNTLKLYVENGFYHIYSRGVDRREIFYSPEDCSVFLYYLKIYLSSPSTLLRGDNLSPAMLFKIYNLNLFEEVDLLSFALMPNHFHLQVKQKSKTGIQKLMRRVLTGYAQYFNKKYKRVGTLFESTYKAALTTTEPQHIYLSSYIHQNPMKLKNPKFNFIEFSSYPYYLHERQAEWVKPNEILNFFSSKVDNQFLSYKVFVENLDHKYNSVLSDLTLEEII